MSEPLIPALRSMKGSERELAAGAYVFHTGDPVARLFVVLGGAVELVRHQPDGGKVVLQRAGRNAVLAEASVFSERYHCDAIAVSATRLLAVPVATVRERFALSPDFAESWAAHLAREVQNARMRAEILSLGTVAERLDAWLAAQGGAMPERGGWKSVAHEIGVSPEALYRELAKRR